MLFVSVAFFLYFCWMEWNIGAIVYLITDEEQKQYMITGYIIREKSTTFLISSAGIEVNAYKYELTDTKVIF